MCSSRKYAYTGNLAPLPPPQRGIRICWGWGWGSVRPKFVRSLIGSSWGGRSSKKNPFHGVVWIFSGKFHTLPYMMTTALTTITNINYYLQALLHVIRHLPLSSIGLVPMSALLPVVFHFHFHEEQICHLREGNHYWPHNNRMKKKKKH